MNYIYLHGFASSVQSRKAQYFIDRFAEKGLNLITPDLNLGDFSTITLSKQLAFLQANYGDKPCRVMGSSLGGLLATLWASDNPLVESLLLLAPAFQFSQCLQRSIGAAGMAQWQTEGVRNFYHYGYDRELPLHYDFFLDAMKHSETKLERELPLLIIHGIKDDVVLPQSSEEFAQSRPWVKLLTVDSDHSLGNVVDLIWREATRFWHLDYSGTKPDPMIS